MNYIFLLLAIFFTIEAVVALKGYYKDVATGRTWFQALGIYFLMTVGLFVIFLAIPLVLTWIVKFVSAQSGLGQIFLIIMLASIGVGILYNLVSKRFSGTSNSVRHVVNLTALIYFVTLVVDIMASVFSSGQPIFWQLHALIVVFASYFGYQLIKYWEVEGREVWGVAVTYVIDCVMLSILGAFIGHSVIGSMEGSLSFFVPLLGFNFLIFWVLFGMGDPKSKRRISRALVTLFTFALIGIYGVFLFLQITGNLEQMEMWGSSRYNQFQHAQSKLNREVAYIETGAREAAKQARQYQALARQELAKPNPDMELVKSYQGLADTFGKKVEAGYESQKNLPRPENVFPEEVERLKVETLDFPSKIVKKLSEKIFHLADSDGEQALVRVKKKIIKISQSGIFYFDLEPLQGLNSWLYVEEKLSYRVSASDETPFTFYVKYKRGDLVKMDKPGVKLPGRAGSFKLIAGEKGVKITLLVTGKK